jgi:Galactose-3-O-sulfotransferase
MLRDPVERILSYFYYDVHRGVRKDTDLEAYIHRNNDPALDNYMTRILSGSIDLDPPKDMPAGRPVTNSDLYAAVRNMESCLLVDLTERFDETLVLLSADLRWSLTDMVYVRKNRTPSKPDISYSTRLQFLSLNQYDAELVERAKIHLARRIAAYPGDFQKDLTLFRRLNTLLQQGSPIEELQRMEYEGLS